MGHRRRISDASSASEIEPRGGARSTAALLAGQWTVQAIGVASGLAVLRSLPPETYGPYALALATVGILAVGAELGLNPILTREVSRRPGLAVALLELATRWRVRVALVTGAAAIGCAILFPILGPPLLIALLWPVLLSRAVWTGMPAIWTALGRVGRAAWLGSLVPAAIGVGAAIGAVFFHRAEAAAAGQAIAAFGVTSLLLLFRPRHREVARAGSPKVATPEHTAFKPSDGVPLLLASLATILFLQADLYVASLLVGAERTAFYAAPLRLLGWLWAVPAAWGVATLPAYSLESAAGRSVRLGRLGRDQRRLFAIGIVLLLGSLALAPLTPWLLGSEYRESIPVVRLLGLAALFACAGAPGTNWLTSRGRLREVALSILAGLVLELSLAVMLGRLWGLPGIALAKSTGAALQLLGYGYFVRRAQARENLASGAAMADAQSTPAIGTGSSSTMRAMHPFDEAAPTYDRDVQSNPVLAWMRMDNLAFLDRMLPQEGWLLELGAGTGQEALALARGGRRIMATDPSPGMLAVLEEKLQEEDRSGSQASDSRRVRTQQLRAGDLAQARLSESPFVGAYASLGVLNCEPDLKRVAEGLAHHLRPGAPFVVSIMNRWCTGEIMGLLLRGRPAAAFRRFGSGPHQMRVLVDGQEEISTWFFSPRHVRRAFSPWFRVRRQEAFPLLLPPPSLAGLQARAGPMQKVLESWEPHFRSLPWTAGLGDHFRICFERK